MNTTLVKLTHPNAKMPDRVYDTDAGWNIYPVRRLVLGAGKRALIPTGLHMAIPVGYYGRLAERSGYGSKGLGVGAGVIDASYRGEIKVVVYNRSDEAIEIVPEKAITQIIFERVDPFQLVEADSLDDTERGMAGFGSSDYARSIFGRNIERA